jgi:DNA-binding transcriptional LysR family regulator
MRATFAQIEAFYWIARLGGFHAAAARLHLTQPTISLRIRALEEALGVTLFERTGRTSRLTHDGRLLLPQAERMVGLLDELHAKGGLRDPLGGQLRLGAPDSFGLVGLPRLLAAIREAYPALRVALIIDNSHVLGERLNERELDFAILADPNLGSHVVKEFLGSMELAWVASRKLGLPDRALRPADLAAFEIFTNPQPSNLIMHLRQWFAPQGVAATNISTCNDLSVILNLTKAGAGVSLLPTSILPRGATQLRVLKVQPQLGRPRLYGAYQLEKAGTVIASVMAMTRRVVASGTWVARE